MLFVIGKAVQSAIERPGGGLAIVLITCCVAGINVEVVTTDPSGKVVVARDSICGTIRGTTVALAKVVVIMYG